MLDDVNSLKEVVGTVNGAEKVIPTVEATDRVRKDEMVKLMNQVGESLNEVGPYATVVKHTDNKGDFVILNQPVDIPGGDRKGIVIFSEDGFMFYKRQEGNTLMKTDDDLVKFPGLVKEAKGQLRYAKLDGVPTLYGGNNTNAPLVPFDDEKVVVKAINHSILKAQEGPKKTIEHNQATITAAGAGQAAIAVANIK